MADIFDNLVTLHHNPDPLRRLARLVRQLRNVQRSGGSGYKTTAQGKQAADLEKQVDAAVSQILGLPTP